MTAETPPDAQAAGIRFVRYETARWGVGELVFAEGAVVAHELPNRRRSAGGSAPTAAEARLVERLQRYFAGAPESFGDLDLGVALERSGATAFEAEVVRTIQAIPWGQVRSYLEVAERAGRQRAARAAGNVCARGTLDVIVPYHRVIASDGSIGSYGASGVRGKRRLLALEGVHL